ncbi:hypothetical protein C8R46DRAFT_1218236 [Mycena filopes]|nr:hypothetical protein C8R46DRAFT_1218236 [Mycena filopes]
MSDSPPSHSDDDARSFIASVHCLLNTTRESDKITPDEYKKGVAALDYLKSIFREAPSSRVRAPRVQLTEDPDAELLRNHHAKMAARVAAIDLELAEVLVERTAVKNSKDLRGQLESLRSEEKVQERTLEETRRKIRDHADELGRLGNADKTARLAEHLVARQAALERERAACTHIITAEAFHSSPIRRVPADILTEIFLAAQPDLDELSRPMDTGIGTLVSRVCAFWRTVAHTRPRLWSTFAFPLFGNESARALLEITLHRCRGAALTVMVDASVDADKGYDGDSKLALLASHAENIVSLRFRGNERFLGSSRQFPTFDSFRDRLLGLEVVGLSNVWRGMGDAFQLAPRLHTLELCGSSDLIDLKAKLPVSQVRTLRFSVSTSGHHLASFTKLTSMVSVQTVRPPPLSLMTPPPLRSLTTWRVEFPGTDSPIQLSPDDTTNFFCRFRTPALRSLHLRNLGSEVGVIRLLETSRCDLSTLILEDALIIAGDLLRILACTPNLQALTIISGMPAVVSDDLFVALTIRDAPLTDILLRLTDIRLNGAYLFDPKFLLEMLESRVSAQSAAARLKTIEITLGAQSLPKERVREVAKMVDRAVVIDQGGIIV